jgi:hypothetical protein
MTRPAETHSHGSASFMAAVFALLRRGYAVELVATGRGSYQAKIRNQLDVLVGDMQYRDPIDEKNELYQGLSFASHTPEMGAAFGVITPFI